MPVYSYKCPVCGRVYEQERKMKDRHDRVNCEDCFGDSDGMKITVACSMIIRGDVRHTWGEMAGRGLGVGIEKGVRGYKS